jgi:hypothetical protein
MQIYIKQDFFYSMTAHNLPQAIIAWTTDATVETLGEIG